MEQNEKLRALETLQKKLYAYNCASNSLYLDAVTVAPKNTAEGRGVALSILAGELQKLMTAPETLALVEELYARRETLDTLHRREVEELRRSCRQLTRIPAEEYMAYSELTNRASDVWHKAKEENDFASFCPILQELVEYNRKFAGYYDAEKAPYDALLNEYERGMDTKQLDVFFDTLRKGLVPSSGPSARSPRSMTASCIWNIRSSSRRRLRTISWRSWALTGATAAWVRPNTPLRWSSTTRMSASPPTTTCTMWPPRCTPFSTREAMPCMSWASGMTCSTPA